MGILYESAGVGGWAIWIFIVFALMAFNELGRSTKWGGIALFFVLPLALTVFVWPTTAAPGNEYGTGTWFNWVKTYSALAGCLGFMALRYVHWTDKDGVRHSLVEKTWARIFPPAILAINIAEAVIRDFQVFSFGLWQGGTVENLWTISGPWNIMNGIAGILNIVTICGWLGIFISKDRTRDMIWPDMFWGWILAYDFWNFAYTYNCISDHSFYCGPGAAHLLHGAGVLHQARRLAAASRPHPGAVDHVRHDGAAVRRPPCTRVHHPQPHDVLHREPGVACCQRRRGHLAVQADPLPQAQPAQGRDLLQHEVLPGDRGREQVACRAAASLIYPYVRGGYRRGDDGRPFVRMAKKEEPGYPGSSVDA